MGEIHSVNTGQESQRYKNSAEDREHFPHLVILDSGRSLSIRRFFVVTSTGATRCGHVDTRPPSGPCLGSHRSLDESKDPECHSCVTSVLTLNEFLCP